MAKNDRTDGILMDLSGESGTPAGNWQQLERRYGGREKIAAQIDLTNGSSTTVVIEGRLGPGFPAVELATVTDADFDGLITRYPQIRANVTANSGTPDVKAGVDARTRDTGA